MPGFNPNEVAGTLTLLMPVALVLCISSGSWPVRLTTGVATALMCATLVLTGSRSAFLGVMTLALGYAAFRWRWQAAIAGLVAAVAAVGIYLHLGGAQTLDRLMSMDTAIGLSSRGRIEIWARGLQLAASSPVVGIGLNSFPLVSDLGNSPALRGTPVIAHAHNLFLQTALDLGVPGLVAFCTLLATIAVGLARSWTVLSTSEHAFAKAMAAGLLAHLAFGLTDAVALGAKPGVLLWTILGALAALEHTARQRRQPGDAGAAPVHFGQWALFALCTLGASYIALVLGRSTPRPPF